MSRLAIILALLPTALWADDIPLISDVTAVTLYPDGATITREVPISIPEGRHQLILTDLPKSTPLQSVRVAVTGATMGSVTTRNDFVPPRSAETDAAIAAAEAEVERLEDALRDGMAAVHSIRLEADAAQARVNFLRQLGEGEGVAALDVAALRDLAGMIGEETLIALRNAHEANRRAARAERGMKDVREELDDARKALAALVPEDEARAMLAVAVETGETAQGMVTVTYNIRQANWLPVYDVKLTRDTGRVAIERGAFVSQYTGENWVDVAMTLSTVRPSDQTAPGDIFPWLRRIVDPEQEKRKTLSRAQSDTGFASGAMVMEEPVMEETAVTIAEAGFDGLAVTYSYPDAVSVASGADRVRLALGRLETGADLVARAVPLHDTTAFLVAEITNDTGELILPSHEASFYLDGRYIGQQVIGLIPAGGKADLAFGPVEGLRLTRVVLERNEGDRGVISRSNELTEQVRIEVENLTGETWPVRVLDRVPYSEQEDLEIDWTARPRVSEQNVDDRRGILAWEFDLAPGATQEIALDHSIEWPDGMELR